MTVTSWSSSLNSLATLRALTTRPRPSLDSVSVRITIATLVMLPLLSSTLMFSGSCTRPRNGVNGAKHPLQSFSPSSLDLRLSREGFFVVAGPKGVAKACTRTLLGGPINPLRLRCDLGLRLRTGVVETGGSHGHNNPHLHVMVAQSLAREPNLPEEIPTLE